MSTHLPPYWAPHLLAVIGGHSDAEKLRFLDSWTQAEGGSASFNPLNTTFPLPGATDYNSVGVKNYPRPVWGVCATALTLTNPASGPLTYPKILGHLQSATGAYTAEQIVADCGEELRHWGTEPALILAVLQNT